MIALWVALGAVVGAPARYLTDRAVRHGTRGDLPLGTLAANLVACLGLGALAGTRALSPTAAALLGTGFCGTLSTWSSFALEAVQLAGRRRQLLAGGYVLLTLVGGILLAAAGWAAAAALS